MADDSSGGEPNVGEGEPHAFISHLRAGPPVSHYYGDYVRQIFMPIGALMLLVAPFLLDSSADLVPLIILGAILLVGLAAFTSPTIRITMIMNVIAAALGVIAFELVAMLAFTEGKLITFVGLEAVAVAFLVALYFSAKTLRNMMFDKIGRRDTFGDFTEE